MPLPLPLLLLHSVPLPTWRALLDAYGVKRALRSVDDVRAAALEADAEVQTALRALRVLARDDARAAILLAARVLGVDATAWPADVAVAGLAAALLARAPTEPAIAEVLRAAELYLCRRSAPSPKRRFVGPHAKDADVGPASLAKLAKLLARANGWRQAPGSIDVVIANPERASGEAIALDVIRPDPVAVVLTRDARGALAGVSRAPLEVDRVVIERPKTGGAILWVATSASELLPAYCEAVGEAVFGDGALFGARPLSLRALQRLGRATLQKARAPHARLRDVRVISVVWDPGREETLTIDGRDVLAAVEREELPSHGRLLGARLRLDFDDGPVDVAIRAPNLVHWEECPHDDVVRAVIDALSLDAPGWENLVTLAPHDHAAWIWRAALGDALFEELVARGLFVESTSRALAPPGLAGAGRIMLAFALGKGGKYYVVPEEGFDAAPWLARAKDLVTYRLDLEKLGAELQRALGAVGGAPKLIERGTLVSLGIVTVGQERVWLYLAVAARAIEGIAARLRAGSGGAQPVIVVPAGTTVGMGCAEAAMEGLGGPYAGILVEVAKAIGVTLTLDAWARAPKGTRLVVDRTTERTWLDGVELVALAESARVLARVCAAAGGKPVPGAECDRKLSGARGGAGAAKKAKARFPGGVEKSFAMAGKTPPKDADQILEGTRAGYRVTVPCWVG